MKLESNYWQKPGKKSDSDDHKVEVNVFLDDNDDDSGRY